MTVEYHPAVERELKEIRDFYESRVPGRIRLSSYV
jgi:hypothetical protein